MILYYPDYVPVTSTAECKCFIHSSGPVIAAGDKLIERWKDSGPSMKRKSMDALVCGIKHSLIHRGTSSLEFEERIRTLRIVNTIVIYGK